MNKHFKLIEMKNQKYYLMKFMKGKNLMLIHLRMLVAMQKMNVKDNFIIIASLLIYLKNKFSRTRPRL